MAAAAASAAAAVADLGTAENVTVAVRIRPLNAKEASEAQAQVWRPLPGVSGHMQLYTDKGEPVPKQTYAYGAWGRGVGGGNSTGCGCGVCAACCGCLHPLLLCAPFQHALRSTPLDDSPPHPNPCVQTTCLTRA